MSMVVMGVDPGARYTGYGIIEGRLGRLKHMAHGLIVTPTSRPLGFRLCQIYDGILELLRHHRPHCLALEDIFLAANVQAAFLLGQVRGVVILAAAQAQVPIHLYSPLVIKKAVVGYGQATKSQVKMMVEQLLGLEISSHHVADALAVGVCHYFHQRLDLAP